MMTISKILHLYLILYESALASEQCSTISVQWQCESENDAPFQHKTLQQTCFDSLDGALNFTKHEVNLCQGQLQVNMTFNSTAEDLNSNVTFSNTNFSHLSFLGAPNSTLIHCKAAALRFDGSDEMSNLMEINIQRMTFLSCGPGVEELPAALFFNGKCQIQLSYINVEDSNGSGLALIHVLRGINVTHSSFIRNKFVNGFGAGVHVTLSFDANETVKYNFVHCVFKDNKAIPQEYFNNPFYGLDTRGGGLFVQYKRYTHKSQVVVHKCHFSGNMANWGAGLLGRFDDNAYNNTLSITSTTFNYNHGDIKKSQFVAGAGAMINILSNSTSNVAQIYDCNFTGNVASWGGGVEFYSKPAFRIQKGQNVLSISRCQFKSNFAYNGAAVNMYCSSPATSPESCNVSPSLSDSNFTSNGNLSLISPSDQIVASIVLISHFPAVLEGTLIFSHNSGSPLHVHETSATLKESAILNFHDNSAQNGGAISLYGSWITVSNNSKLIFSNNRAMERGGALYASQTNEAFLPYIHHCFIRYSSKKQEKPWHWNASFNFSNNTASDKPEIIYATSLLPCVWRYSINSTPDQDIRATFCSWNNWYFGTNVCMNVIHTSASNFSSTPQNVNMFPGVPNMFVSVVDDFGHNVTNFTINPSVLSTGNMSKYRTQFINKSLIVYGHPNTNVTILLELEGDRPLFMMVYVSLQECPPGFSYSSTSLSCDCHFTYYIHCNYKPDSHWIAYLITGFCISYSPIKHGRGHDQQVVFGRCPFTAGRHTSKHTYTPYLRIPLKKEGLNNEFCGKFNRTGMLCGDCVHNYSIDLFSDTFDCHKCSGSLRKWLLFVTVEGLPSLLFFVIVLLLHISFTSGPANGFIFFSQVLTVSLEIIVFKSSWMESVVKHPKIISNTIINLYSIWSLDFSRLVRIFNEHYKMCLGPQIKVIHVVALRYLSAIYPLCFLLIAYTVIELHARNCRILVWLWKPLCFLCARFRQAWKAKTSVVDAFAAFILLSYVKVVRISLVLTTFSNVNSINSSVEERVVNYDPTVEYLSTEHAPFAAIGVFFLLTFGLIPPLLLTFYQFKFFQRCLNRFNLNRNGLRIFMDAFQGCYKDGKDGGPDRRFFAGFYFIFRLIIFAIFNTVSILSHTYMVLLVAFIVFGILTVLAQPYKNSFYTYLDIFFFNLLAVIMALQVYTLLIVVMDSHSPIDLLSILFSLAVIPLVYISLYVLFWFCQRAPKCVKTKAKQISRVLCIPFTHLSKHLQPNYIQDCVVRPMASTTYSEVTADDTPDRLANSFRYRSLTLQSVVPYKNDGHD